MNNDLLGMLVVCGIAIVFLVGTLGKQLYDYITFYTKPKFRINKETHLVEYWHSRYNCWLPVCGWDSNDSGRTIVLHQTTGNEIIFKYNGPGRYGHKIEGKLTQKQLREKFPYKSVKELYEEQSEYINNENIITSKIIHEKFKLINN